MTRPTRPPPSKMRADTTAKRAMTKAMQRVLLTEHRALWNLATIWSRDCPAKLRRLQTKDWTPVFAQARWTPSSFTPRL